MTKVVVLYIVLLALLDTIAISSLRRFLYDFLIGARNRKNARNIYRQRSLKDRVFLGFIRSFLKSHRSAFDVYHWIYLMELVSLVSICNLACSLYAECRAKQHPHFFRDCSKRPALSDYPFSG